MARYRTITPAIPYIFLSDADGEQVFNNAANQFHTWDTTMFKTSDFIYVSDSSKIFINKQGSGLYEITFEVSWKTTELRAMLIYTDIYVNGVKLPNSRAHTYVDDSIRSQHTIHYITYLKRGDYVQIASRADDANVTTDSESSRLSVKFVAMKGWDNSHGGKENYRGEVVR